jgi:ABC-type transport system involved in multi-copper enzyme maturation permease subunit
MNVEMQNFFLMAGLYAITFLSIAMAALLGADTLAGEINSGTIQTIVSKPIRRADVILGKWLGFAGLLGLYLLFMAGGVVLSMFIQSGYVADNLLNGLGLIYLETLLIMTITLMCSASFPALATGGIVFGMYGLAFIGGWIEQIGAIFQNPTAVKIGILTSLIIPSESLWRRAAFEMQTPLGGVLGMSPFAATSVPSPLMIVYAILYLVVALNLSIRIFQGRDL